MDSNYVSSFFILSSLHDVKIGFAAVEPELDQEGHVVGEIRCNENRITMSPALAKDLIAKLTNVVNEYEERYGKIPSDLQKDEA